MHRFDIARPRLYNASLTAIVQSLPFFSPSKFIPSWDFDLLPRFKSKGAVILHSC